MQTVYPATASLPRRKKIMLALDAVVKSTEGHEPQHGGLVDKWCFVFIHTPRSYLASVFRNRTLMTGFLVPPLQYPQCSESVPATGRAKSFHLEVGLPLVAVLEQPAAIIALRASDDVNRLGQAWIARGLDRLEVIKRTQDIVVPARREGETDEDWLDDRTRAM